MNNPTERLKDLIDADGAWHSEIIAELSAAHSRAGAAGRVLTDEAAGALVRENVESVISHYADVELAVSLVAVDWLRLGEAFLEDLNTHLGA